MYKLKDIYVYGNVMVFLLAKNLEANKSYM